MANSKRKKTSGYFVTVGTGEKIQYNSNPTRSKPKATEAQKQAAEARVQQYRSAAKENASAQSGLSKPAKITSDVSGEAWTRATPSQTTLTQDQQKKHTEIQLKTYQTQLDQANRDAYDWGIREEQEFLGGFVPQDVLERTNKSKYKSSAEAKQAAQVLGQQKTSLLNQNYENRSQDILKTVNADKNASSALKTAQGLEDLQRQIRYELEWSSAEGIDRSSAETRKLGLQYGLTEAECKNIWSMQAAITKKLKQAKAAVEKTGVSYDDAYEYLRRQELSQDAASKKTALEKELDDNGLEMAKHTGLSVLANMGKGVDYVAGIAGNWGHNDERNLDTYRPMNSDAMSATNYVNTVRGKVGSEIQEGATAGLKNLGASEGVAQFGGEASKFLYDTGMSIVDNAAMMAVAGVAGAGTAGTGYIVSGLMGTGAAADQMKNILDNGGTNSQALAGGLAAGVAEALFEKVSIDALLSPKNVTNFKSWAKEALKQGGVEASEEVCTELANMFTDALIRGQDSDFQRAIAYYQTEEGGGLSLAEAKKKAYLDAIGQVALAGLGGFISGGVMQGFKGGVGLGNYKSDSKAINTAYDAMRKNGMFSPEARKATQKALNREAPSFRYYGVDQRIVGGYNETKVSPAASEEVQQTEAQAQVTQAENPGANVLDAATTLFTQQGMKLKTAQEKAGIVQKLIAGEEVSVRDINKLNPTSKESQAIFTQLTGVQFPEGKVTQEQLYTLYRSAHDVAVQAETVAINSAEGRAEFPAVNQVLDENGQATPVNQMSEEQILEQARAAREAANADNDAQAAAYLAQMRGEIAPDGNALIGFKDFSDWYQTQKPGATREETAHLYDQYLKDNQSVEYRGQRLSHMQFMDMVRNAPTGSELTEAEAEDLWQREVKRQQNANYNKEDSRNGQGQSAVYGAGLQGQSDQRSGMDAGGLYEGTGRAESESGARGEYGTRPEGAEAVPGGYGEGSGGLLNNDAPVRTSTAADGRTVFNEVSENAWSDDMKSQTQKFSRVGIRLRAAVDRIPIPGTNRYCDGVSHLGVESIVQSDSPFFTFEQLCDHESGHQYFFRDRVSTHTSLYKRCVEAYKNSTTAEQRQAMFTSYLGEYAEVYAQADKKARDQLRADIREEIICDAYAGMNRNGYGADQLQDVIKPIIDEWCAQRDAEMQSTEQKYSIDSLAEAVGLTFEKDGQVTVFKDAKGNAVDEVTEDHIRKAPLGAVIQSAVDAKLISKEQAGQQVEFFSKLYNMMLKTQDIDLLWAVNSSIGFQPLESGPRDAATINQKSRFAGYTKNSDPQYSTTVDFTTICVKTQAIIDAMSETMMRLGRGLTEDEIVNVVYKNTHEAGEPVPCPVCYVFSRWVGLGGLFNKMNQLQVQYANADETVLRRDIAELEDRIYDIMVERGYEIKTDKKTGKPKLNGDAREAMYKELVSRKNELSAKQNLERLTGEKQLTAAENAELDKLNNQIEILDNWTWLRDVRLSENYEPVPSEILFNINAGKEFAEQYPESWKYRTTRGPAMGKAATPYADEHLGQILRGAGISDLNKADLGDTKKNPFLKGKNGKLTPAAQKALQKSRAKIKAQNLLNGQRYQSTSDFRFEYALDYLLSFVEMQSLGGKVQLYTKVAESVPMFASVNGEVNCSLMPLGIGYRVNPDGSKTLVFSSVTGMNAEDAFNLSAKYDNVQPIMVGVNNEHIRLCMADDRITFIIPYHASGASEGRYVSLMKVVGENVEDRTDYSNYQTDHSDANATPEQKAAYDLRLRILTGNVGMLSEADQKILRRNDVLHNLYKRFYGKDVDGQPSAIDRKYLSPEARDSGESFYDPECFGVFLTKDQAKTVMPFEYWDRTSTIEQADANGQAFVDYCDSIGLHPRFSGWDANGVYHADMDFSKDSGYWKMLVDRSAYNRDGSYHEQKAIDVTGFDAGFLLRDEAIKGIVQPSKVNDPGKTAEIVEKSIREIAARSDPQTVEASDLLTKYSLREEEPPKKVIRNVYKAFYARDGKLYPPMVANLTEDEMKTALRGGVSGTMKSLDTPVGVWLDADIGKLATDADGNPLRNTKGRLAVVNEKGGGTLAFRPGWHLGEWPDAKQFNKDSSVYGPKSVMPDGLVFARCEIAADIDYQLDAMSLGMGENGKFNRTQAGLPMVPVDGYYKYRTNVDPNTAPWYITGAMRVVEILDDEDCAKICAEFGVKPSPRQSGKPINLADYGLKRGPVEPTKDVSAYKKTDAIRRNTEALKAALNAEGYENSYVSRPINFDDAEIRKEFDRNRQNPDEYREKAKNWSPLQVREKSSEKKYSVIGPNAYTANIKDLGQAVQMQTNGATNQDIWEATGWWQGRDGYWRFEIDDSEMQVLREKGTGLLEEFITHDQLFAAYPWLKKIPVKVDISAGTSAGYWNGSEIHIKKGRAGDEFKSTLIHEIQHVIQEHENFSSGANYDIAYRRAFLEAYERIKDTPEFKEKTSYLGRVRAIEQEILTQLQNESIKNNPHIAGNPKFDWVRMTYTIHELYQSEIGETEARNTSERVGYDEQKRQSEAPFFADSGLDASNYNTDIAEFRRLHLMKLGLTSLDKLKAPLYNRVRKYSEGSKARGIREMILDETGIDVVEEELNGVYSGSGKNHGSGRTAGQSQGTARAHEATEQTALTASEESGASSLPETNNPDIRYSIANPDLSFAEQVGLVSRNRLNEVLEPGTSYQYGLTDSALYVQKEPNPMMQELGYGDYALVVTQDHIRQMLGKREDSAGNVINEHNHQLTVDQVSRIPELLRSPAAVLVAKGRPESLVFVTTETDYRGRPIIIPVKANGTNLAYDGVEGPAHVVTSMYGRDDFGKFFSDAVNRGELVYYKKERIDPILTNAGYQSSGLLSGIDSDTIVGQVNPIVKNPGERKFSITQDSTGRELTKEQQEFFKDSKVRDAEGRLTPVYHGTPNGGFTEFKLPKYMSSLMSSYGPGFYFTDKNNARQYMKPVNKSKIPGTRAKLYETYLNITNPFEMSGYQHTLTKDQVVEILKNGNYDWFFEKGMFHELGLEPGSLSREKVIEQYADKLLRSRYGDQDVISEIVKAYTGEDNNILDVLKKVTGNDGLHWKDGYGDIWVAWDANQIKNVSNKKPTESTDIRYSITPEFEQWYLEGFTDQNDRDRVKQEIEDLRTKYGTIPSGENPTREVNLPRKIDEKTRVHDTARTVMEAEATPEKRLADIQKAVLDGKLADVPVKNDVVARRARARVEKNGWQTSLTDWTAKVRAGETSADLVAEGAVLLNNAGNSDMSGEQYVELLTDYSNLMHRTGQSLQAARILKTLSPEGRLYGIQKTVDQLNDSNRTKAEKKKGFDPAAWAEQNEIKLDPALVDAYRKAKTDTERDFLLGQIQQNIADQMPASLSEKLNNWRYLAMLGNFRTQIRNVLGNFFFQIPREVKETVAGGIEGALEKAGVKIDRTRSVVRDNATYKAAMKDFDSVRDVILSGGKVNEKMSYLNGIDSKRRIYKNKVLEGYRRVVNTAMDSGDAIFCKFTYADSLARFMAANHTTWDAAPETLREKGRLLAIKEAAEATYRDNNAFSEMVLSMRFKNPGSNKAKKAVNAVVEGILPFRKTPANILVRGVEYSPLGLVKTAVDTVSAAKGSRNVTGSDLVNEFAKSLTGSGLFALGYFLTKMGVLTALGPDDDDKEKEFWELQGNQSYSINLFGRSYTIDWLAPEAIPLLVGANTAEIAAEDGLDLNAVTKAATRITDPMLEMSMLQGVNSLIENIANTKTVAALPSLVLNSLWSYGLQYVPTLTGQLNRSMDNTRRTTYTDATSGVPTGVQYSLGKLSQKVPGWSYNQIPYIDQWGRMEDNYESKLGNAFAQFLSPAYQSIPETSDMERELQRLYDATGETGVLPSKAPKYLTVDGERRDLTAEEYVNYATLRGQTAYDMLTDLTGSAVYRKMSDKDKVKAVGEIYSYAADLAKQDLLGGETKGTTQKAVNADSYGISSAEYAALKTQTAGIESLKYKDQTDDDGNPKTIQNSRGLQTMEAVYSAYPNLTKKQYEALFEALGVGKTIRGYSKQMVQNKLKQMRRQAAK